MKEVNERLLEKYHNMLKDTKESIYNGELLLEEMKLEEEILMETFKEMTSPNMSERRENISEKISEYEKYIMYLKIDINIINKVIEKLEK